MFFSSDSSSSNVIRQTGDAKDDADDAEEKVEGELQSEVEKAFYKKN